MEVKQFSSHLSESVSSNINLWLVISLLFNLVIHLAIGLIYYNPVDFVLQFEAAKKIAEGNLLYRDIGELYLNGYSLPRPQYPPLYLYTLGTLIAIVGKEIFTWQMAKIFLILVSLTVGLLIFHLLREYLLPHPKSNLIALAAFNFFLLNPSTLGITFGGFHDNFMLLFVLIGFIMFKRETYYMSGVSFGLALLVKPIAGIYLIPILIWGVNSRYKNLIQIWLSAGFTFILGSLPFLIITPENYLNDVFFVHTQRLDPSMSIYTYFFPKISVTFAPFLIQIGLFLSYLALILIKSPITDSKRTIEAVLPFMTIFMASNRILYPHYLPFFFPFFTFVIFFLIDDYYRQKLTTNEIYSVLGLLSGLIIAYIGSGGFSLLWYLNRYENYQLNPLFLISSITCVFGLCIMSFVSLFSLITKINEKKGNFSNEK